MSFCLPPPHWPSVRWCLCCRALHYHVYWPLDFWPNLPILFTFENHVWTKRLVAPFSLHRWPLFPRGVNVMASHFPRGKRMWDHIIYFAHRFSFLKNNVNRSWRLFTKNPHAWRFYLFCKIFVITNFFIDLTLFL